MQSEIIFADFPCPVCSCPDFRVWYPDTLGRALPPLGYAFGAGHMKTYRIVRCRACGHAYASPRPENLYRHYADVEDEGYLANSPQQVLTAQKAVECLRRLAPGGRLLDIGCATGDFLLAARGTYGAEGLELSSWSRGIARSRGFTVHDLPLAEFFPDRPYDVATLWGVVEHFEFPAREARQINRILRPGGHVALWTGDIDGVLARLLGKKWWYFQGQHIQLFSRASLDRLFLDAGFERAWLGRYPYVMTLKSVGKSLRRYPLLGAAAEKILSLPFLAERKITFRLPGEMFAVYRKTREA